MKIFNWFYPSFYVYLFKKADNPGWSDNNKIIDCWNRLVCRYKGHPGGSIYYNPYGYEPDDRCRDCGDLI